MKTPKPLLTFVLLLLQFITVGQVQWYQNQDGHTPPPDGTVATSIQGFTRTAFIAGYLWNISGTDFTWKISKTNLAGTEEKSFFITGTTSLIEVKAGHRNTVYVMERKFPSGQSQQCTIYKLDANLRVIKQKTIDFTGGFTISSVNAFEVDENDNVYLAGNGDYFANGIFNPGSYIVKTDRNLNNGWKKIDSSETNYSHLLIDSRGFVNVIADHYSFFPDVHITRITPDGQWSFAKTITTDPGRFDLYATLDDDNNILLYGGKTVADTAQGMFLYKVSAYTGRVLYRKTHFISAGTSVNDFKTDEHGNIFTLVSQYFGPDDQRCKISRISSWNGNMQWSRSFNYTEDSCYLYKLVMNRSDRFYAVGEKKRNNTFSKGFSVRMKKNGNLENKFTSPDSTGFQRSHWLVDGIIDHNDQLISIGNTMDLDTITWMNSYLRAFAIRFGNKNNGGCDDSKTAIAQQAVIAEESIANNNKIAVYPNPVQNQLNIANLNPEEYDRLAIYNMAGALLLQQKVTTTSARMDVTGLPEGMYLLVFKSSALKPDKSTRFIIRH